jgi:hypothetical protein
MKKVDGARTTGQTTQFFYLAFAPMARSWTRDAQQREALLN